MESSGYLERLASAAPTPGGGSAAALVAQTGAALVAMVARIAAANPKLARHHDEALAMVARADRLREKLRDAGRTDELAYEAVVAATALPRTSPEERELRTARLQHALAGAALAPLVIAELGALIVRLAERALALENENLTSDLGCAAEFGAAAVHAAAFNVRVNHRYLRDVAQRDAQAERLEKSERDVVAPLARVRFETARAVAVRTA